MDSAFQLRRGACFSRPLDPQEETSQRMDNTAPRRAGSPLYVQLAGSFRRLIASNAWPVGSQVKTVEALADEYGVARITVRQAMDILEREGLVDRARGRGTHVRALPHAARWHRLLGDWDEFSWSSPAGRTRVLEDRLHEGRPPGLAPGEPLPKGAYRFLRVVTSRAGGPPISVRRIWAQERIYRRVRDRLAEGTAMALLGGHAECLVAHLEVTAADAEAACLLEIPAGTPVVEGRHVAADAAGALAFLDLHVLRGEFLKFEITICRPRAGDGDPAARATRAADRSAARGARPKARRR
jgi:GntR family transcriptional regulator